MARYLVEVPHEETTVECARAVEAFLRAGSHFLARADWGCKDGVHKAWLILDLDSREEARNVLPPLYRARATVVGLNDFTLQEINDVLKSHRG